MFLGQFELLGAMHRRVGGQGVVQFARSTRSMEPVAIKFFLNTHAFECEQALYMREGLRGMMPAISLIESNASVRPFGFFSGFSCLFLSLSPLLCLLLAIRMHYA